MMSGERILFVTGRLAEVSLRELLVSLSSKVGFAYEVSVLGISVAALMSVEFVSRKLRIESKFDRVILPGWCGGDLDVLSQQFQTPFERGPKDLFDLPEHFGGQAKSPPDLSRCCNWTNFRPQAAHGDIHYAGFASLAFEAGFTPFW